MKSSRRRRHVLAVVAVAALAGLGAGVIPQFATATPHPRSLGTPVTSGPTSELPDGPSPASCVTVAGCDLWAHAGVVSAGTTSNIPIWGFTTNSAANSGELGGSANNTIIIKSTDTLTINLHNDLPAGAGNLSLEVPAAQVPADLNGVAVGGTKQYVFAAHSLAPGTYVYQAGGTVEQPRQLAMGLGAVIIVRPSDYDPTNVVTGRTAYLGGLGQFKDEALVVMNEIDPLFNSNPLAGDVEDYSPKYFFINGKAHPNTTDISANHGDTVLMRVANLGIRDRAIGMVNSRMWLIGQDSHQLDEDHKVNLESQLLTAGEVADLTTMIDPSAPNGAQFPVMDLNADLNNGTQSGTGGMLTFIDVVDGVAVPGAPVAKVTSITPTSNDGSQSVAIAYTISGSPATATWYLDNLGGACSGGASASGPSLTLTAATLSAGSCGALWVTGDHVLWIQPAGGVASGGVFTLAKTGPTVFGLATDPQFANLSFNKTDPNPPGGTDVLLTGSALPSLLDRTIDQAEACLTNPGSPSAACPAPLGVSVADAVGPSHAQALSLRVPVASFPTPNALNTIYIRAHESGASPRWSGWGDANSTVGVVIDKLGPVVSGITAQPSKAGIGDYPGNLNFLESVRIQANISDALSPIADAELFLYTGPPDQPTGTGSQLRPLAGQWLDDPTVHARTAYLEIPVSELQSQPQGPISIYIHAKDAAGNWGTITPFTLDLDKTNPLITSEPVDAGNHRYMPDETNPQVLSGGTITLNACDPNGVSAVGSCPATTGALATNPVSQLVVDPAAVTQQVQIRYHVAAITGQIGTAGAGIFYQTAQRTLATATYSALTGTYHLSFEWDIVPQPPLPIEAASSVWVWVLDAAGNPSVPVEVPVGPATPTGPLPPA